MLDNYETAEGVSLPRSTLYNHYLRHCQEHKLDPVNAASFGKLIRSIFMGLRTRRLGTRLVLTIDIFSSSFFIKLQQCCTLSRNVLRYRRHKGDKCGMKSLYKVHKKKNIIIQWISPNWFSNYIQIRMPTGQRVHARFAYNTFKNCYIHYRCFLK